jgi:pimeloyl-ACP methyl ester carboxylesterase
MLLDKVGIRDIFYNRCDPKDVDEAVELLGSFPMGPLSVPVTYSAFLEIPSTYIVTRNDQALPESYQERMIAQAEGAFTVERCDEGHSPFLSNPGLIVHYVRRAAGEYRDNKSPSFWVPFM